MIKVLHIFGKMNRGGAEMRTVELMPLMAEKGVHFDFCTLSAGSGQLDDRIRELGGDVFTCPLRPGTLTFGHRFVKFLKQSGYDIVHSHVHYASGYIVRLAYKAGIKGRIVHFRNTTDGKKLTIIRRFYCKLMHRMVDKYATAILAVCEGAMEFGWGSNWKLESRAKVIYNGLDTTRFQEIQPDRQGLINELNLKRDCKLVINIASMNRQKKAHDILLDAAAKITDKNPTVVFLLAGDGILRDKMEDKAAKLGITNNVRFLGVRDDVPMLLKASDCFVLPSRWEGLPGVVLEAIAAKLPVVATDLPGVREIAEHTNLISIVPVENKDALAKGILETLRTGMTQAAENQHFPEEFGLERCAEKLFEVYHQQVEG